MINTASFELTSSQIKRLHTEELKLVHAPNANTIIIPQSIILIYNHNGLPYTLPNSHLEVHYEGSNQSLLSSYVLSDSNGGPLFMSQIQSSGFGFQMIMLEAKGKHLYLRNTLIDPSAGNGTLNVIIHYLKLEI